jgi:hypothetical protein
MDLDYFEVVHQRCCFLVDHTVAVAVVVEIEMLVEVVVVVVVVVLEVY